MKQVEMAITNGQIITQSNNHTIQGVEKRYE